MALKERGAVLWFTGLSGAGKSTLAEAVAPRLRAAGIPVVLLVAPSVWAWRAGRIPAFARSGSPPQPVA